MSRYQPYPSYKDSGVEWLGEVPEHWNMSKLKYSGEAIIGLTYSPNDLTDEQNGTLVLRSSNVQNGKISLKDNVYVTTAVPKKLRTRIGDILICSRNGSRALIGKNAMIDTQSEGKTFGAFMTIYRSKLPQFIYWVLNSSLFSYQSGTFLTSTINQLTTGNLNSFETPFPPIDEQTTIANFLDKETAKIDTLIEKQQRLIELLREKRQAVISHAVTKGLDPDVAMKDSGVEWLGEVPEGWEIYKFNHCALISEGQVDPRLKPYDDYLLIAPNHIEKETGNILALETAAEQGADSGKYLCKKGHVIYSKIRPALAKVCVCPVEKALCSADMYSIHCTNGLSNEFLYWYMLSPEFTSYAILQSDRVAMPKLNRETLGEAKMPIPSQVEQQEITTYLDTQTSKIDTLIQKANQAITLLKERRSALISAAVTGKIDVRDFANEP